MQYARHGAHIALGALGCHSLCLGLGALYSGKH